MKNMCYRYAFLFLIVSLFAYNEVVSNPISLGDGDKFSNNVSLAILCIYWENGIKIPTVCGYNPYSLIQEYVNDNPGYLLSLIRGALGGAVSGPNETRCKAFEQRLLENIGYLQNKSLPQVLEENEKSE